MWTPQERQAIRDATDFLRNRLGDGGELDLALNDVDPSSIILGLIVVADYAVGIAAEATSPPREEMIDRIARGAAALGQAEDGNGNGSG
jgi:hypothetical protein